jgi:hypothetical protein
VTGNYQQGRVRVAAFLICLLEFSLGGASLRAAVLSSTEVPDWWRPEKALRAELRQEGEKLAANPGHAALGEMMLARHYGIIGDLSRESFHLKKCLSVPDSDPVVRLLANYELASCLRLLRSEEGRRDAIDQYRKLYDREFAMKAGLDSPTILEAWRLIDAGDYSAAEVELGKIPETDDAEIASAGFALSEIVSRREKDPIKSFKQLEETGRKIGAKKFLSNPSLMQAAAIYQGRLFKLEDARQLIQSGMSGRSPYDPFLPEAEIARFLIMECKWDEAADWLGKAQRAKMTLLPGVRQEAMKDLRFAVADYYIASGNPSEAFSSLSGLEDDFLRAGFTTEAKEYYLGGLYLRLRFCVDRMLTLDYAAWRVSSLGEKITALPHLISQAVERERLGILFRQSLCSRIQSSFPGSDIGTLVYAPPWLLPEMKMVLGKSLFRQIFSKLKPEGDRLLVISSLVDGVGTVKTGYEMPVLLKAIALAANEKTESQLQAYRLAPSSFLIVGQKLPVKTMPAGNKALGWVEHSETGLVIQGRTLAPDKQELMVSDPLGKEIKSMTMKGYSRTSCMLEEINRVLLNADTHLDNARKKHIQGRNLSFSSHEGT